MVFSDVILEQIDGHYVPAGSSIRFASDIWFTPWLDAYEIDEQRLHELINGAFQEAEVKPSQVDSGAVILTGLALERRNAEAVARVLGESGGRFVAVLAGDLMEAELSARGSGTLRRSANAPGVVLNIDIGGGTTKFTWCEAGQILATGAIAVGARLATFDDHGRILTLEAPCADLAEHLGIDLETQYEPTTSQLENLGAGFVRAIAAYAGFDEDLPLAQQLLRTPRPNGVAQGQTSAICVSGGVSEYLQGNTSTSFGDLGPHLAAAMQTWLGSLNLPVWEPVSGIRATVLGASTEAVQVSGSTIYTPPGVLPIRDVPVVRLDVEVPDHVDTAAGRTQLFASLNTALSRLDHPRGGAVVVPWIGPATVDRLEGVGEAFARCHELGRLPRPLVVICTGDVAGLMGRAIQRALSEEWPLVVLDGLSDSPYDFVDVGEILPRSDAVAVVIKTLLFP